MLNSKNRSQSQRIEYDYSSTKGLENVGVVGWERDWAAEAAWLPLVNIEEAEGDLTRDMWWLVLWLALLVPRAV